MEAERAVERGPQAQAGCRVCAGQGLQSLPTRSHPGCNVLCTSHPSVKGPHDLQNFKSPSGLVNC